MKSAALRISFCLAFISSYIAALSQTPYLHAPAIDEYARHDPNGTTILPTGRLLKPAGRHFPVAQWPHGLVMSPDGSSAFVASEGVGQLITAWDETGIKAIQISSKARAS